MVATRPSWTNLLRVRHRRVRNCVRLQHTYCVRTQPTCCTRARVRAAAITVLRAMA